MTTRNAVGLVAVAAIVTAVVYGLLRIGSPSAERERRLDIRRTEDLREIADAIDLHWTRHNSLPPSLERLPEATMRDVVLRDPETGALYEYRMLSDSTFELCAFFETDSTRRSEGVFWAHPAGHHCFALEARDVKREKPVSGESRDRDPV